MKIGIPRNWHLTKIIANYLNNNKTVCVTTMANKGIIELVKQKPLNSFLTAGRISKSNFSADERRNKAVQGLKPIKNSFIVPSGELLCLTNYVLSQAYNPSNFSKEKLPTYDLIIIEEASQAFLASILAFKLLGKKCLIVGDPMQLPPIVKTNPKSSLYRSWNIETQINGLKTFALGTNIKSFRVITTFRLTPASADLTGIFYNNRFSSVQIETVNFSRCNSIFFPSQGGVLYYYTQDFTNGVASRTGLDAVHEVVHKIEANYPKRSLAIISPFKETVKCLQKEFLTDSSLEDFIVETIDRIQGATVDYAIVYIPGRNPGFALDERRFNVATSRSRSTTLIISDIPLLNMLSIPAKVATFIGRCQPIECQYRNVNELQDLEKALANNDIKALYPGMENIIDELINNNIPFSHEGDVDLLDRDGVVIATAGLLLNDYMIAIDLQGYFI